MNLELFGTQVVGATIFGLIGWASSFGLSIIFARVYLGIPFNEMIKEIEDDQNAALGVTFFVISLLVSLYVGFMLSDGFTDGTELLLEDAVWFVFGFAFSAVGFQLVSWVILRLTATRQGNDSVAQYRIRELRVEDNDALALFLGSIAVSIFIPVLLQII